MLFLFPFHALSFAAMAIPHIDKHSKYYYTNAFPIISSKWH